MSISKQETVIFHAPQGWGKTTQAETLKAKYGCNQIVDEWHSGLPVTRGALHLTHADLSANDTARLEAVGARIIYADNATHGGAQ